MPKRKRIVITFHRKEELSIVVDEETGRFCEPECPHFSRLWPGGICSECDQPVPNEKNEPSCFLMDALSSDDRYDPGNTEGFDLKLEGDRWLRGSTCLALEADLPHTDDPEDGQ